MAELPMSWGEASESSDLFGDGGACGPFRPSTPPLLEPGEIHTRTADGYAEQQPDPYADMPHGLVSPPSTAPHPYKPFHHPDRQLHGHRGLLATPSTAVPTTAPYVMPKLERSRGRPGGAYGGDRTYLSPPRHGYGRQLDTELDTELDRNAYGRDGERCERGTEGTRRAYDQERERYERGTRRAYDQERERYERGTRRAYDQERERYERERCERERYERYEHGQRGRPSYGAHEHPRGTGFGATGVTGQRYAGGRRSYVGAVFMRLRSWRQDSWYEFLMEHRDGAYQFPTVANHTDSVLSAVETITFHCARRGMLFQPKNPRELDACLQLELVADGTPFRVYLVPFDTTQRPKPERRLRAPPPYYWVTESELAVHAQMGPPAAFGCAIHRRALAVLHQLPLHLKFASMTPPLVVYHGTDASTAQLIGTGGMLPSAKSGMLGAGMYFAKWDKAVQFSLEDADRVARPAPGSVVRAIVCVAPAGVKHMQEGDVCTCGCGQPFVDHKGHHGSGVSATFVGDNSLPATRRAEWCVRNPDVVLVDGLFVQ